MASRICAVTSEEGEMSILKRIFDLIISFFGLAIVSPLLVAIALMIKEEDGGPVFYRGVRVGLNGKLYRIFKLRTMVVDAETMGGSSTPDDDPRITIIGKTLRKYKLDELPQFINVLRGEMSLVGPRPQVPWAVALYNDEEKLLLSVRPGITDYASIKYRNESDILKGSNNPDKDYLEIIAPKKIRLGLKYVKKHSVWVDMKILFMTFKALIVH
jgi:lipopolysaccharide/colanic/teichoic acid biosynthesis glycosyltransferase